MGVKVHMQLTLNVEGATVDEIVRGLTAAQAVFVAAGTTPYDAASASFQRDGYEQYLGKDGKISADWMTSEEDRICMVWDEAEAAAIEACCAGWANKPASGLELVEIPRSKRRTLAA